MLGAGLRGLTIALRAKCTEPACRMLVVDGAPQPGGRIRTQRSNGFACELGPFAFDRLEVQPLLDLLPRPPRLVELRPEAHGGRAFTGTDLVPVAVEPRPVSFASGNEELVQACRRELGPLLRLGRTATAIHPFEHGWEVELGGESPSQLSAPHLTLALPVAEAARLLAPLDPELAAVGTRLQCSDRAFAFFGGHTSAAPELQGYGLAATDGLDSPLVEAIFCSEAFPGRALPGRFLVRCELTGPLLAADDDAVLAAAAAELRRWSGVRAPFPFTKLHRFACDLVDAALVECRTRLQGLAARAAGLTIA